jgi:hypothetical protein
MNGGYPVEALPYLEAEIKAHPEAWGPWNNLGICYKFLGRYDDSLKALKESLRLSDTPPAHHNIGIVYEEMGMWKEALDNYVAAAVNTSSCDTQYGMSTCLLRERKFDIATPIWESARLGKKSATFVPNMEIWRGQDLKGKKLLVTREGGYGDIFWLLRYLRPLKEMGAHVTLYTFKSQMTILDGHPWIDRLMNADNPIIESEFDYQVPLWSIMWELRKCRPFRVWVPLEMTEPYIRTVNKKTLPNPDGRPVVGISYSAGEMLSVHRKMRSIQPEYLGEFAKVPVRWVSLVLGEKPEWCEADLSGCKTWLDTAEIVAGLDLVVASDSSVMHLAAAMNKPVWTFVPSGSDWKWWHEGETTSWYPSMRVFRNPEPVSFKPVVDRIVAEVTQWAEARKAVTA